MEVLETLLRYVLVVPPFSITESIGMYMMNTAVIAEQM